MKRRPEFYSIPLNTCFEHLYEIWTHDLCDTGALHFITAKIAFIFTSLTAVQIYDFHIFTTCTILVSERSTLSIRWLVTLREFRLFVITVTGTVPPGRPNSWEFMTLTLYNLNTYYDDPMGRKSKQYSTGSLVCARSKEWHEMKHETPRAWY